MLQTTINNSILKIIKDDLTLLETDALVYYAQPDLKLGSGFGNAIAVRGGASIQDELNKLSPISVGEAVITLAGELKAKFIIHAVGPRFQEPDTVEKLSNTVRRVLAIAEENGIKKLAFPPMGTGFYGISLEVSSNVMLSTITNYLSVGCNLEEVIICVMDNSEYSAFQKNWNLKEKV